MFRHCEAPVFLIVVTSLQRKNTLSGARDKEKDVKYLTFTKRSERTVESKGQNDDYSDIYLNRCFMSLLHYPKTEFNVHFEEVSFIRGHYVSVTMK